MADSNDKGGKGTFQKKEHRPWKTSLLEMTVQDTDAADDTTDLDFKLDVETDDESTDSFYTEFNFVEDEQTASELALKEVDSLDFGDITTDLRSEIRHTEQQKKNLVSKLHDKSSNSILLGGFFQPGQLGGQPDTPGAKRMHSLLSDLKSKEHRLGALTRDLQLSEAKERVEQAELNKKAELSGRIVAENRMREAIEQAQVLAGQFKLAMGQANSAVGAHQEEERLRLSAEDESKDANLRANNAELSLQNEKMARMSAEEKMQEALNQAENTRILQEQLSQTREQLQKLELVKTTEENKRLDAQQSHDMLNDRFSKLDQEHRTCSTRIHDLDNAIQEQQLQTKDLESKVREATAQRDKLKEINYTEQKLRKIAEQKMQDALRRAAEAERGRKEEERQRKTVDERAKRAVAHASRTVMQILNAPDDEEYSMKASKTPQQKPKIKVPADGSKQKSVDEIYDFEEDDFNY